MGIEKYVQVGAKTDNGGALTKRIAYSIRSYLQDYQNTANNKESRIEALRKAAQIIEHILTDTNKDLPEFEVMILHQAFMNILVKVKSGIINRNNLYNFKDEIGFLKILEG